VCVRASIMFAGRFSSLSVVLSLNFIGVGDLGLAFEVGGGGGGGGGGVGVSPGLDAVLRVVETLVVVVCCVGVDVGWLVGGVDVVVGFCVVLWLWSVSLLVLVL
jgi:hypothetical protein